MLAQPVEPKKLSTPSTITKQKYSAHYPRRRIKEGKALRRLRGDAKQKYLTGGGDGDKI